MEAKLGITSSAGLIANQELRSSKGLKTHYKIECIRDGKIIWIEEFDNLVVTAGLNDSLEKHLKGSAYTAAWYVGLTDSTPTFAPADTMASHAGWTEVTDYDEVTREALVLGAVSGGSVDNSASRAAFTINNTVTVGGVFVAAGSAKGESASVLYGGAAFSGGDRNLLSSDVLNITVTFTATAL